MSKLTKGCEISVSKAKYGCLKNSFEEFTSEGGIIPVDGYITWHLLDNKLSETLSKEDSISGVLEAITYLEPHMGQVKFKQTETPQEAQVVFGFYKNSDGDLPEPFETNTLAYAYLGNGGRAFNIIGDMYFNDEDFAWTLGATRATVDFTRVWLHECLHSLGLHHQTIDSTGILYPSYNPNVPIKLTQDTINGLNTIYGNFEGPKIPKPETDCLLESMRKIFSREKDLSCLREVNLVLLAKELGLETDIRFRKSYTVSLIWNLLNSA